MQDKRRIGFAMVLGLGLGLGLPAHALGAEPGSRPSEDLTDDERLKVFEGQGCEPADVVCLDGDGNGWQRGPSGDRDRLPANLEQGRSLTVKVIGCAARYDKVGFSLSLVGGPKHEQLFRADFSAAKAAAEEEVPPSTCTSPSDFAVLSSVSLEVPAAASVELRFEREAATDPPLAAASQVHAARVLRPLYFLDISVAAPFVLGGKRKVSTRSVPDLDASVLTLEEDLRVSPAVMLHVFPGGRRLGAISSFSRDRVCAQADKPSVDLGTARTTRDAKKATRDRALVVRDRAMAKRDAASERRAKAETDRDTAATGAEAARTKLDADELALVDAQTARDEAQAQLDKARATRAKDKARADLGTAEAELRDATTARDEAVKKLAAATETLTAAEAELTEADTALTDAEQQLSTTQVARDAAQKTLDEAQVDVDKAEAKRCRHLRRARYAANSLGVQLGIGLDLGKFGDEFYTGLFFEPVVGLNIGAGMAIIKGDELNPGYALGQIVDPSQTSAYGSESFMIRPYVGISLSFDIIRNIRAATKAPEVTKLAKD